MLGTTLSTVQMEWDGSSQPVIKIGMVLAIHNRPGLRSRVRSSRNQIWGQASPQEPTVRTSKFCSSLPPLDGYTDTWKSPQNNNTCTCSYGADKTSGTKSVARSATGCASISTPTSSSVRFADLNGDGRAEYLWLSEDGSVSAYLNRRLPDPDPAYHNVPNPKNALIHWNPQGVVAPAVGGRREQIHFADLNGDGRAEYLVVHPNGSVSAWLNTGSSNNYGPNAAQVGWRAQGLVFDSFGMDGAGVRFADLNGDGLPEYLHLSPAGSIHAFHNNGGPTDSAKINWSDAGVITTNPGVDRASVVFADLNGDGRADLLEISRADGSVRARMNLGVGAGELNRVRVRWGGWVVVVAMGVGGVGEGVQFADLNSDGRAEYLDVAGDGRVRAWVNGCAVGGALV